MADMTEDKRTFVMTWRSAGKLRAQPLLACSLAEAWARAFEVAEALGCGPLCGFAVRRCGGGA